LNETSRDLLALGRLALAAPSVGLDVEEELATLLMLAVDESSTSADDASLLFLLLSSMEAASLAMRASR
jgi:hypothetical protein